ncbi:hypothetical protein TWF173_011422 [Orbilia oligospora]|nr:hypothetical protein TWF173_011422 [Orbilia oligospora]
MAYMQVWYVETSYCPQGFGIPFIPLMPIRYYLSIYLSSIDQSASTRKAVYIQRKCFSNSRRRNGHMTPMFRISPNLGSEKASRRHDIIIFPSPPLGNIFLASFTR